MSIEAEKSVIGCVLMEESFIADAANDLSPEMFQNDAARSAFEKICDLYWAGRHVDVVTLLAELPETMKPELVEMADLVPAPSHFKDYERIVQNDWLERELQRELFSLSQEYGGPEELLGKTRAILERYELLTKGLNEEGVSSFSQAAREFVDWLHEQKTDAPRTGYGLLDRATGGLLPGSVFVIAARPGGGKTDFAVNLALRTAKHGAKVLCFTLEMTTVQLMQRVASNLLRINGERLRDRALRPEELERVDRTLAALEQGKSISFVEEPRISVSRVRHYVELWRPDVIIIDHIGLMERGKAKDPYRALGEISNSVKQLALEKKMAVIELVQMNRAIEARGSKIPNLSDLRESGDLEQDADYVGFLVPEDTESRQLVGDESAVITLYLQKNRHGRAGQFQYRWQPQYHSFSELEVRFGLV